MTISLSARQIAGPLKGSPWSAADIEVLREMRADGHKAPAIALRLGRTVGAVYAEAKKAGSIVMVRKVWTEAEIGRLHDLYLKGLSEALIAEALDRSPSSVRAKVELLGLAAEMKTTGTRSKRMVTIRRLAKPRRAHIPGEHGSWSYAQMDELVGLSGTVTLKEAAERIGRPLSGVRAKAKQLGVEFVVPGKDRSERDTRMIEIWKRMDNVDAASRIKAIAEELGVSKSTVFIRARELELRKARVRRRFNDEARAEIARLAPTMTANGVARETGWDLRTVRRVGQEDGLVFAERAPRPVKTKTAHAPGTRLMAERVVRPAAPRIRKPRVAAPKTIPVVKSPVRKEIAAVSTPAVAPALVAEKARERRREANRIAKAKLASVPREARQDKAYAPEVNRGSEERLQTIREVYLKMKRKGYFPPRDSHVER